MVVQTIAATTTTTGLRVRAALDENTYPTGIKVTDQEFRTIEQQHLRRHDYHGEWNYSIAPAPDPEELDDPTATTRPTSRQ